MAQERAKAIFWTVLIAVPVGKAASTLNDIRRGAKVFIPEKVTLETREVADKSIDGNLVRSPKFLDNDGSIKWPDHKGFELDSLGNPLKEPVVLQKWDIVDCYDELFGTFTSPVNDGHSVPFYERGLPYAYISKYKEYHQYKFVQDINLENVRRAYEKLTPNEAEILNKNMDYFEFSVDDIANPQMGKIAQVFGLGGCILILLV